MVFSGVLVIYKSISYMKKRSISESIESPAPFAEFYRFINVPIFYLRRFFRLWPSIVIGILFYPPSPLFFLPVHPFP